MADDPRVVTVTFYAAARAAAGTDVVRVHSGTLRDVLAASVTLTDPRLAAVLERCSVLVDGVVVHSSDDNVAPGSAVDVLPPFAGG